MLRRLLITIVMLSVVFVAFALGRWQSKAPQAGPGVTEPAIGFAPSQIDLGTVVWHTRIPFTLVFRNRSDIAVTIGAVKASCGCTGIDAGLYAGKQISAGEELPIAGELHVGTGLGQRERDVELMLMDGTVYTASLNYVARSTYTCMPDAVKFGTLKLDAAEGNEDIASRSLKNASTTLGVTGCCHASDGVLAENRASNPAAGSKSVFARSFLATC